MFPRNPPVQEGDFLWTRDAESLALFQRAHEFGGLEQRVRRARIEPGIAATHALDAQLSSFEIGAVQVSDFQFSALGRLEIGRDLGRSPVIEIEPGDRPARTR